MEIYDTDVFSSANTLSYWRMEGNSNDSKDSNNGSDTTITYNASYGKYGQGASLNGSSSFISIGNPSNLDLETTVSLSACIYPTTITGYHSIIHDATGVGANGQYSMIQNAQKIQIAWGNGVTSAVYETTDNVITSPNAWYLVTITRDGSRNPLIYINRTLKAGAFTVGSNAVATYSSLQSLSIGRYGAYSDWYFSGYIDDVAIFDKVLSQEEISEFYWAITFIPKIIWF